MGKIYTIFLGDKIIGTTLLEKADPPMGVVFGNIIQTEAQVIDYDFIKAYCLENNIALAYDHPEDKCIATTTIEALSVRNELGVEIKGIGNQIFGMDSDVFEIDILGISYPFYEEEFPQHIKDYHL